MGGARGDRRFGVGARTRRRWCDARVRLVSVDIASAAGHAGVRRRTAVPLRVPALFLGPLPLADSSCGGIVARFTLADSDVVLGVPASGRRRPRVAYEPLAGVPVASVGGAGPGRLRGRRPAHPPMRRSSSASIRHVAPETPGASARHPRPAVGATGIGVSRFDDEVDLVRAARGRRGGGPSPPPRSGPVARRDEMPAWPPGASPCASRSGSDPTTHEHVVGVERDDLTGRDP